jgi:hypothetical protein
MKMINKNTPREFSPDYSSFIKFVSNCEGDWDGNNSCVYWKGHKKKRFYMNGMKISPKNLCYMWRFGKFPGHLTKYDRVCMDSKCIKMDHFKEDNHSMKKRKTEAGPEE